VKALYHSEFPNIRAFWSVNTLEGTNVSSLKGLLGQIAVSHPLLGQAYPSEWNLLEKRILQLRRARLRSRKPPCLSWTEMTLFARKHCQMDHAALVECVHLFHELGILLHYDCTNLRVTGSLQNLCVIDCQWLIDLVKTLITTKHSFGKVGDIGGGVLLWSCLRAWTFCTYVYGCEDVYIYICVCGWDVGVKVRL
jgi:hypothetical protein